VTVMKFLKLLVLSYIKALYNWLFSQVNLAGMDKSIRAVIIRVGHLRRINLIKDFSYSDYKQ